MPDSQRWLREFQSTASGGTTMEPRGGLAEKSIAPVRTRDHEAVIGKGMPVMGFAAVSESETFLMTTEE